MAKPVLIYKFGLDGDDFYAPKDYPVPNVGHEVQIYQSNWIVTKVRHYLAEWENCIAVHCSKIND